MILFAIILFLTIFEATHEGLALLGKNTGNARLGTIAGLVEMFKLTGMVAIVLLLIHTDYYDDYLSSGWHFWRWLALQLVIGWLCIRYAIFDFIHNAFAGIDIWYIGKMKLYDKFFTMLLKRQPKARFFVITRILLLVLGLNMIFTL
jgi:hypothetical protein